MPVVEQMLNTYPKDLGLRARVMFAYHEVSEPPRQE